MMQPKVKKCILCFLFAGCFTYHFTQRGKKHERKRQLNQQTSQRPNRHGTKTHRNANETRKTRTKSNIFCVSVAVSPAQMITWKPLSINRCTTFGKGTMEMMSESLSRKTPVFRSLTRRQSRPRKKKLKPCCFLGVFLTYWKVERCPQDVG